jgi:AcrR family transcriptional regulator
MPLKGADLWPHSGRALATIPALSKRQRCGRALPAAHPPAPNVSDQLSTRSADSRFEQGSAAATPIRKSFRATQFEAREEAILDATNRLLSLRGYELMSMDDIAAEVGIAKGSLYKHFASKDTLAVAVMLRLLRRTSEALDALPESLPAVTQLRALLEWVLRERLAGGVPHLPSTSSAVREALTKSRDYVDLLITVSERIGTLIRKAQGDGAIATHYREEFLLYHFYARACDPTLDFLRESGALNEDDIVDQMTSATFEGLAP